MHFGLYSCKRLSFGQAGCCLAVLAAPFALAPASIRADNLLWAGDCEVQPACGYKAFISWPDLVQECQGDSWRSFAWPFSTLGTTIDSIQITMSATDVGGDLYLVGDGGGCPNLDDVLWEGCCAIGPIGPGPQTNSFCTGPIETPDITWLVLVPHGDASVTVNFDLFPQGLGHAFVNLSGERTCGDWIDLTNYQTKFGESYGGCYCVALGTDPCEPEVFTCGETEPVVCEPLPTCDGDANRDGAVDPLDTGYILARFGVDPCASGNCTADVNCDGVIDPLDAGYSLARFGQCISATSCPLNCP